MSDRWGTLELDAQGMGLNATRILSRFAAELRYEDIPASVVHQAKRVIFDTIGCTIAGFSIDPGKMFIHVMRELGGNTDATILPTGDRNSIANVAFANSYLASILDVDDACVGHGHFSSCTVMPALAVAEQRGLSGKELITAVVAGYEVASRISLSLSKVAKIVSPPPDLKISYNALDGGGWAIFGGTASSGRLLGLDASEMLHAFGIAGYASPIPGYGQISQHMPMIKFCPFGSLGWEAVVSGLLAKRGMTGVTTMLDGDRGYWRMVSSDYCDWKVLTAKLGQHWWTAEPNFKVYPTCSRNRPALLCMQRIVEKHQLRPEEIESIVVNTVPHMVTPIFLEPAPKNGAESFSSYPWHMAMLAMRVPGDQWESKAMLANPQALALANKVRVGVEPKAAEAIWEQLSDEREVKLIRRAPASVEVTARGQVFREYAEFGKGHPATAETYLTDDELIDKFRTYTREILLSRNIENAIEQLFTLENTDDVRKLIPALVI